MRNWFGSRVDRVRNSCRTTVERLRNAGGTPADRRRIGGAASSALAHCGAALPAHGRRKCAVTEQHSHEATPHLVGWTPGHLVNMLLVWLPVLFVIDMGRGKQLFELIARQYEREYSSRGGGIMVVPHLLDRAPMAVPGAPRCARCLVKVDARLNMALSELSPCDNFQENLEETPHNAPDGGGVDGDA